MSNFAWVYMHKDLFSDMVRKENSNISKKVNMKTNNQNEP